MVLTLAVARRWPDVLANAVDPGWVATRMGGAGAPGGLAEGTLTQVWLATSDDPAATVTGRYFYHQRAREPLAATKRAGLQDALLDYCAGLTGDTAARMTVRISASDCPPWTCCIGWTGFPGVDEKAQAESAEIGAGGPAVNAAVTAAALGADVTLLTAVGRHPLGELIRDDLHRHGVALIDAAPGRGIAAAAVRGDRGRARAADHRQP